MSLTTIRDSVPHGTDELADDGSDATFAAKASTRARCRAVVIFDHYLGGPSLLERMLVQLRADVVRIGIDIADSVERKIQIVELVNGRGFYPPARTPRHRSRTIDSGGEIKMHRKSTGFARGRIGA